MSAADLTWLTEAMASPIVIASAIFLRGGHELPRLFEGVHFFVKNAAHTHTHRHPDPSEDINLPSLVTVSGSSSSMASLSPSLFNSSAPTHLPLPLPHSLSVSTPPISTRPRFYAQWISRHVHLNSLDAAAFSHSSSLFHDGDDLTLCWPEGEKRAPLQSASSSSCSIILEFKLPQVKCVHASQIFRQFELKKGVGGEESNPCYNFAKKCPRSLKKKPSNSFLFFFFHYNNLKLIMPAQSCIIIIFVFT